MMKQRFASRILATAAVLLVGLTSLAQAAERYVPGEVLVKFKPAVRRSAPAKAGMLENIGGTVEQELGASGWDRVKVRGTSVEAAIAQLSNDPRVEYVEPNYIWTIDLAPNDTRYPEMYQLRNTGQTGGTAGADIRAEQAWATFTGDPNILIGVIDTGIDYNHPDLAANVWTNPGEIPGNSIDDDGNGFVDDIHGYDFVNNDGDPFDDNEHGTHCAGTIAAVGNNALGTTGVNWRAKVMGLKFLSAAGSGSTANAVLCVQYAITMGCRLTSNSWGGGGFSQALLDVINAAGAAGQLFVAAQGNAGSNTDVSPSYPAAYDSPYIIGVAATDHNDGLASFSNFGATTCDLGAPGVNILSLMPGGGYQQLSGTSMACPHVAGAAGFLLGRFPGMTNLQAKNRLMAFADPIPSLTGRCVTGARLNLFMAAADPDSIPPGAVADLATQNPGSNTMGLAWTATGDDGGTGTASEYDVRYSTSPINAGNFGAATRVSAPNPSPAGSAESMVVNGLSTSTTYYFALKALDEFGNAGPVSNLATGTTLVAPDIDVTPTSLASTLTTGASKSLPITISNPSAGTLSWSIPTPSLNFGTQAQYPATNLPKGGELPSGPPQLLASGGPDGFGYRWQDSNDPGGPVFGWIDIAQPGNLIGPFTDDSNDPGNAIGFSFPYYGNSYSNVNVCSNGWLSFTATSSEYSNTNLPSASAPRNLVAPFWDDLNPATGGAIYAANVGGRYVVSWVGVPRYQDAASVETFQAVLYPSGEIRFQYLNVGGTLNSATVGIQNSTGTIGLAAAFNQAYVANNLAVRFIPLQQWLTTNPRSGFLAPGASQQVDVQFNATGLASGVYTGAVHVLSNDPDEADVAVAAQLTVNGAPNVVVTPASLDFGSHFVGSSTTLPVTVANNGVDPLTVSNVSSDDGQFTATPTSFTVAPSGSQTVQVTFVPGSAATFNATLSVASNDPDQPTATVAMTGTGTNAPVLVVTPGQLRAATANGIGARAVTKTKDLVIQNNGGSPLTWTASAYQGVVAATAQNPPVNTDGVKGDNGTPGEPQTQASGGPDAFGYRWIDSNSPGGPAFAWQEISGVGTLVPLNGDDQTVTGIALPFAFPFYGGSFNTINICSNGWVSFSWTGVQFVNTTLPNTGTGAPKNGIFPFWDDQNFSTSAGSARCYTYYDGSKFIVEYKDVPHYAPSGTGLYTYQVFLYPNGTIEYQYLSMSGLLNSNTVGIQNAGGTVGLQIAFDQAYVQNNLRVRIARKPDWLTLDASSGTIPAGGSTTVHVTFSANEYADGDYDGEVRLTSNDPLAPTRAVPAHMHVGVASASVAMVPRWLSSVSGGPTVTMDVQAPGAPEDISASSLEVNGAPGSGDPPSYPGNGHGLFKFRVLDLLPVVDEGKNVPITAIGEVTDQTWFSAGATINVVKPQLLAGPLAAFGSQEPTFRAVGGQTISMAWKDPAGDIVTGYEVHLSEDNGATWTLLGSTPERDFDVVLPHRSIDGAMVEIVAMDNGRLVGSWLSAPFQVIEGTTGVDGTVPARLALRFANGNPARGSARIELALPQRGEVEFRVHDLRGGLVKTLAQGSFEAGRHLFQWDGTDVAGTPMRSGVYFVKAYVNGKSVSGRLALVR